MATYEIKRSVFLTPNSRSVGSKAIGTLPNRVTLRKGDKFEGQLVRSNQPNVESTLIFDYEGYHFEKPYGGTDMYASMNARDIVRFLPEGALQGTPLGNSNVQGGQYTRPMEGQELGQNSPIYSIGRPNTSIAIGEINPNAPTFKSTTKSLFEFKDKLHAGMTLVGVALGAFYAYKTKASIGKYIGYTLGAGAVGYILGSVASSFAMEIKQAEARVTPEGAKPINLPAFDGVYSNGMSIEEDTMETQMNSIL
jgi:hypothetical protein